MAVLLVAAGMAGAEPLRVVLLDCADETGGAADAVTGGVTAKAIAAKGAFLVGKQIAGTAGMTLVDRRDFLQQVEKSTLTGGGKGVAASEFQAARALNADLVLKTSLMSFSTASENVNQGGHKSEAIKLAMRVGIQILNPLDGAIVGMADGSAVTEFRQTAQHNMQMSEDELLSLFEKAAGKAVVDSQAAISKWQSAHKGQKMVKLTVVTTADPALVEIDGMLVGTSPLKEYEITAGDHVITIGKAGHADVSKKILIQKNTELQVPMLKKELSADEAAEILKNWRVNVISGVEPAILIKVLE